MNIEDRIDFINKIEEKYGEDKFSKELFNFAVELNDDWAIGDPSKRSEEYIAWGYDYLHQYANRRDFLDLLKKLKR